MARINKRRKNNLERQVDACIELGMTQVDKHGRKFVVLNNGARKILYGKRTISRGERMLSKAIHNRYLNF